MKNKLLIVFCTMLLLFSVSWATDVGDDMRFKNIVTFDAGVTYNDDMTLGSDTSDTITLNSPITSDISFDTGQTVYYLRSSSTDTSGSLNNVRARGQATAASGATGEVRGVYAQGVTNAALYGGTVTAMHAEAVAKNTSTTVTLRGAYIASESEATPTDITNMYGLYLRTKSHIEIADNGEYYGLVIDNEKLATGFISDAFIDLRTSTWGSGVTAATYGIDMNMTGKIGTADIRLQNGETIANTTDGLISLGGDVAVSTILAMTPQSLTVTTEADITLTGSLLLLTGDDDTDNDTIDLQNGSVTGQTLTIVGVAAIDANDTITVGMGDTTCTGCLTVLLDEIGDTWGLVWTGSTWATVSNSEVP